MSKSEKIDISVIIPTHNSEKYIKDVVASLKGQNFEAYEALFIDSTTSDSTLEILLSEAQKDERFKVIRDDNGSYGHKINAGIDNAKGTYLTIFESDDRYKQDSLQRLWNVAEEHGHTLDFIKGAYSTFEEQSGGLSEQPVYHLQPEQYNRVVAVMDDRSYWDWSWHHIWTGMYKVSFLRSNKIRLNETPGASYQDSGFGVLTALYGKKVMYISDIVYMYRKDNELLRLIEL